MHEDIGHLGIFVSGKVAKKEHAQIVSVLKSVELLPPGLYAMKIHEAGRDGNDEYTVSFEERRLEEITARLNRFERNDEKPFEAVAAVSEFNQRAYELFAQPLVQSMSNEATAKLRPELHPLRVQRWALSDFNPWLAWLAPAAQAVRSQRQAVAKDDPARKVEKPMSELMSASLDYYRGLRDAASEAAFFSTFGNVFSLYIADKHEADRTHPPRRHGPARTAFRQGSAGIDTRRRLCRGVCARRVAARAARTRTAAVARSYCGRNSPRTTPICCRRCPIEWRRIRGEQEIIARYEPEQAIETLPDSVE